MTSPWVGPLTGMTLGGYRLERCIAEGSFGLVFEVTKADTLASFAMKVLPPSGHAGSYLDFDIEGILLKKSIKCSSVINLIETGVDSVTVTLPGGAVVPLDVKYHVLSLASASLEELITDPGTLIKLAWPERISLWRGAIKGVHQMHLKATAHRDLKSSNCLLMVGGSKVELRVADLGRSKDFTQAPMNSADTYFGGLGDFRYAPPEYLWMQGGAKADDFRNADLYGLGSLLVELSTGHPMTALSSDLMDRQGTLGLGLKGWRYARPWNAPSAISNRDRRLCRRTSSRYPSRRSAPSDATLRSRARCSATAACARAAVSTCQRTILAAQPS